MIRTFDERPADMMGLLDDHALLPAARLHRLPNRRALAVLDEMFAYYEPQERDESVDLGYDAFAA